MDLYRRDISEFDDIIGKTLEEAAELHPNNNFQIFDQDQMRTGYCPMRVNVIVVDGKITKFFVG